MGDLVQLFKPPEPPVLSVRLVVTRDGAELCILRMAFNGEEMQHTITRDELGQVIAEFQLVHTAMR